MEKDKDSTIRIHLWRKIELPSKSILGRLRQTFLRIAGGLQLRSPQASLLDILCKEDGELSRLLSGSCVYSVPLPEETIVQGTYLRQSDNEEKGEWRLYHGTQLQLRVSWNLKLSDTGLNLCVSAPLSFLSEAFARSSLRKNLWVQI